MSEIIEYKQDGDWLLAQWGRLSGAQYFDQSDYQNHGIHLIQNLEYLIGLICPIEDGKMLNVAVIRVENWAKLIQFLIAEVNKKLTKNLKVEEKSNVIFVFEGEEIIWTMVSSKNNRKTLLIATRNEGKTHEFKALFAGFGYEIKNLNDFPQLPEIEETGSTFEENARLKAEQISKITGEIVIGDDSGLCVDLLGGLPGVWSHRFAGENPTDAENVAKLLHELASTEISPERRTAHFHTTLVAARPHHDSLVVEADWNGFIANRPQGQNGFGYDPIFLVGSGDRTAAELTAAEKNEQSHRGQALKKLMKALPDWLEN